MILENNSLKIIIGKNVPETDGPVVNKESAPDQKALLHEICKTVTEGGYNPISQLVGFIESDDPTHISNYKNARTMINRIDRDELIEDMVTVYIDHLESIYGSIGRGEDECDDSDKNNN
ncbi:MAG: IreB family regulatory phosphoprotein [Clostridia bacterium]|nr:IreB family regulatory phosphoprotein [Clostridia bacterium]